MGERMTRVENIMHWANQWRTLRAWKRDLSEVQIKISKRINASRLGTCWSTEQRITIYQGASLVEELDTLLHELAHAATIGAHHDARWQEVYAAAVTEVTGIVVVPVAYDYHFVARAGEEALKAWWQCRRQETCL